MKKVLVDANILNEQNINKILDSKIKDEIGKEYLLYGSDILFKQTIAEQYTQGEKYYTFILDFIKQYFENELLASASDIVKREINSLFKDNNRFSICTKERLVKYIYVNKNLHSVIENSRKNKEIQNQNYREFYHKVFNRISKLKSNKEWEKYCYDFINEQNFEVKYFINYLNSKKKYNREIFKDMILIWWRYSLIAAAYNVILNQSAHISIDKIMKIENEMPKDSFLATTLDLDVYKLEHDLFLQGGIDNDSVNDIQYIALMRDFDILLTHDSSFMKKCFQRFYQDTNKQILDIDDFIKIE